MAEHRRELLGFVQRRVRPPIDAADIVQEIWAKALPAIESGRAANARAFLFAVARNLAAEAMRLEYRRAGMIVHTPGYEAIADESPSAHRVANAKDQLRTLQLAVGGLPERCRLVFELRHVEQLGKEEIAERLGICTKQVEKQLRQALTRCRQMLLAKNSLHEDGAKVPAVPT